jgi:DNA-binding NtrC family response regulator
MTAGSNTLKGKIRLLFVDDEIDLLGPLVKRMILRGLDVYGVSSGENALEHMKDHEIDVVVLDVRMPGMNGLETLKEIKRLYPLVEVIMFTGHASMEIAREGMELGAFDYLMKPMNLDDLLYKLEDAYRKISIQREKLKKSEGEH